MEVYKNEIFEFDARESFLILLLHKIWLIGIIGILFAVCTGMINVYLLTPVYASTANIHMIHQQRDDELTLVDMGTGSQLTKNYMNSIKSRAVLEQVIQELKLDLSPDELAQKVNVSKTQDTWIQINVVYSNPAMAKKLVDAIASISLKEMFPELETDLMTMVEKGNLPTIPTNPNLSKKVVFGAVCGILFSIVFLAIGQRMNGSIRNSE